MSADPSGTVRVLYRIVISNPPMLAVWGDPTALLNRVTGVVPV